LVRVTKAGICGTDLHFYHYGHNFGISPGCRLGHEFVGVVQDVGAEVRRVKQGDKVMSPFTFSCGQCHFCREELYTSCMAGGVYGAGKNFWRHEGPVQGGQSEYVRVPLADGTLELVPPSLADDANDIQVLMLTDNFPTGYHAVVGAGLRPGDIVLVIGDGAVGLLATHAASLFGPAALVLTGHHDDRLSIGERLGATHVVNSKTGDPGALIGELTGGLGPNAVIDCITSPESMRFACETVRPGGTISWVGMGVFFGAPDVPWDLAFLRNLKLHGGMAVARRYLRHLWPLLEQGRIDPSPVVTDDLPLEKAATGYALMASREAGSVKVAVSP
jgi:threonine dehydrogenase-like Zn-dependent dehydrogenase